MWKTVASGDVHYPPAAVTAFIHHMATISRDVRKSLDARRLQHTAAVQRVDLHDNAMHADRFPIRAVVDRGRTHAVGGPLPNKRVVPVTGLSSADGSRVPAPTDLPPSHSDLLPAAHPRGSAVQIGLPDDGVRADAVAKLGAWRRYHSGAGAIASALVQEKGTITEAEQENVMAMIG